MIAIIIFSIIINDDITYGAQANISYVSEFTLDIFCVKGNFRNQPTFQKMSRVNSHSDLCRREKIILHKSRAH